MGERIGPRFPGQIQRVREAAAQVIFNRHGLVKRSGGFSCDFSGKLRDARVQPRRKLKVRGTNVAGVFRRGGAQFTSVHWRQKRKTRVADARVIVKGVQQGIREIAENKIAANRAERAAVFAVEISPETHESRGYENRGGGPRIG